MTDTPSHSGTGNPPLSPLETRALAQMRANATEGRDPYYRVRYRYVKPSPGRYEWQWFWDSCFHAIVNARLDPDLARDEMRSLTAAQDPDGFMGHMIYWGRPGALMAAIYMQSKLLAWRRRHSALIQPPFLAHSVEEIWRQTGDSQFLAEMLPRLRAYYDWIRLNRDPDGVGLVATVSPYESGLDNSPLYDEVLGMADPGRTEVLLSNRKLDFQNILCSRNFDLPTIFRNDRFVVYDTLVNAVYADGVRTLAHLYAAAGDGASSAREEANAARADQAINEHCWDGSRGVYVSLAGRARRPLRTLTIAALYPLVLDGTPPDRRTAVVEGHLTNPEEFWTRYPVPTVARSEPSFDPSGERMIWRGPMAMPANWLLVRGLRRHGFSREADRIAGRSRQAAAASGFREFYNPLTGEGLRGKNFGWGTVAVAM